MNIVGVDVGKTGGLAVLSSNGVYQAIPMPLIGKDIDGRAIMAWLAVSKPDLVVVEEVSAMPGQGVNSMFTFGKGFGMILGILEAKGYAYRLVRPQAWKKRVLSGTAKDKDAAIAFVHRAYPQIDLTPGAKRKPHDGIADAVCLAEWGRVELSHADSGSIM